MKGLNMDKLEKIVLPILIGGIIGFIVVITIIGFYSINHPNSIKVKSDCYNVKLYDHGTLIQEWQCLYMSDYPGSIPGYHFYNKDGKDITINGTVVIERID